MGFLLLPMDINRFCIPKEYVKFCWSDDAKINPNGVPTSAQPLVQQADKIHVLLLCTIPSPGRGFPCAALEMLKPWNLHVF